jgi:anti-sigma regulatory factor (Ser/Thr protein kinase)
MPALAPNVPIGRQVLAGLADELDIDVALCADMKIAITEACTNVVLHAYPGGSGPLEVTMDVITGGLVVSVRDRGVNFNPLPTDPGVPALKFGLSLIASLSDEFGIRAGVSGTEVQMLFEFGDDPISSSASLFGPRSQLADSAPPPPEEIVLSLAPTAPFVGVLGRLLSLLAARADFSIDRLSDAQLLSDALASHAPRRGASGLVRLSVVEGNGGFDLRVGPLVAGGGRALIADTELPGVGPLLERLADEITFEPAGGADDGTETVRLTMTRDS